MPMTFKRLPYEAHDRIAAHLTDRDDVLAMRSTCKLYSTLLPASIIPAPSPHTHAPGSLFAVHFGTNPSSSTNSITTTASDTGTTNTTQNSSNNTSDTEPDWEWEFNITSAMTRRLSLLPTQAPAPSLPTLPTEIHLEIFSYLDKIDSCCLGLASPRTYSIYRSIFSTKLPLSTRRSGPNNLERAWEVVGKQMCAHCGVFRCELWKHLESWMPRELEYCSMVKKFGYPGEEGRDACFRVKPSKPRRCGKHPVRTTTVHQDDSSASAAAAMELIARAV